MSAIDVETKLVEASNGALFLSPERQFLTKEEQEKNLRDHGFRTFEWFSLLWEELCHKKPTNLEKAGVIRHDIGKLSLPDEVINKPDKLNNQEIGIMKTHPKEGAILLASHFPLEVLLMVYQHHEDWDGRGYPIGLKGREITREARVLRVADSYDAMVSPRCYRKALTPEKALSEIIEGSGKLYDPTVVNAFVRLMAKG
jgi:HD-GYP domain-containing protein (c-di-GMP phosphodiesterase class II)